MNTNQNTTPASQSPEIEIGQPWELAPIGERYVQCTTYQAPSEHYIDIQIEDFQEYSNVHIRVHDERAFVDACLAHIHGFNHETQAQYFADNYLQSSDLQCVCKYFEEMCIPFADEDEA